MMDEIIEVNAKLVHDRGLYYWLMSTKSGTTENSKIVGRKVLLSVEDVGMLEGGFADVS